MTTPAYHPMIPDPDDRVECYATGYMIPRADAVFDRWGFAYASQQLLDEAMDAADDDADLHRMCAGWR